MRGVPRLALLAMGIAFGVSACSAGPALHTVGPLPNGSFIECSEFGPPSHDDAALEALLPDAVNGRDLTKWSSAGWCLVQGAYSTNAAFARASAAIDDAGVDVADLRLALAGRSDTERDPPYFVYVMYEPSDQDAYGIAFLILVAAGLGAADPATFADDPSWETQTVGGKEVQVGAQKLIEQSEHLRGRPYVYETSGHLFAVIADDAAWAADALRHLP
jgi:hypothetical protein